MPRPTTPEGRLRLRTLDAFVSVTTEVTRAALHQADVAIGELAGCEIYGDDD